MAAVVTLGEVMLRLKSPRHELLFQSPLLEATFGGAEANVAVSLANYGIDAAFLSAVPANAIGDACIAELRRHGVDTSLVRRQGQRPRAEQAADRAAPAGRPASSIPWPDHRRPR